MTAHAIDPIPLPPGLAASAARSPDSPAIVDPDRTLTYRELDLAADDLADRLSLAVPEPGARVALQLPLGAAAIIAQEACARAGLIAVPLEAREPAAILAAILADSGAACLATDSRQLPAARAIAGAIPVLDIDQLPHRQVHRPDPSPSLPSLIVYTSGSTGQPKGVIQTRANLTRKAKHYVAALSITAADRVALVSSLASSQGISTASLALHAGAAIVPYDLRARGLAGLAAWVERERISVWISTPTIFRQLFRDLGPGQTLASLRLLRLGGETVTPADVALFRAHTRPDALFAQSFSGTETGVIAVNLIAAGEALPPDILPVGRPLPDTTVSILDEHGVEVAPGATGRIAVTSRWLSPGYWGAAARAKSPLTHLGDLGDGERRFVSGDLGRIVDGVLEHHGRADRQVKVRGNRVELGRVEAVLAAHPAVASCFVVALTPAGSDAPRLVACFTLRPGENATRVLLDQHLRKQLPDASIPTLVCVPELPLTVSGKPDLRAIASFHLLRLGKPTSEAEPRTASEQAVARAFADALGVDSVGLEHHFFTGGGDSLRMLRAIDAINSELGVALTPDDLAAAPTVRELGARIEAARSGPLPAELLIPLRRSTQAGATRPLVVCVSADFRTQGSAVTVARIAPLLASDLDVVALLAKRVPEPTIEGIAAVAVAELTRRYPGRALSLVGNCLGGLVAFELARQLTAAGITVAALVCLDTDRPNAMREQRERLHFHGPKLDLSFARFVLARLRHHFDALRAEPAGSRLQYLRKRFTRLKKIPALARVAPNGPAPINVGLRDALARYRPKPYSGKLTLLLSHKRTEISWSDVASDVATVHLPGAHKDLFLSHLGTTAAALGRILP